MSTNALWITLFAVAGLFGAILLLVSEFTKPRR